MSVAAVDARRAAVIAGSLSRGGRLIEPAGRGLRRAKGRPKPVRPALTRAELTWEGMCQ
jgi:hypothetical protein